MIEQEKEIYALIDRYINQNLSKEELESFELKLRQDPGFAQEVHAHMEVHQLMMDHGLMNIKQKLRKLHETGNGNRNYQWKYFWGGALLLIVAATSIIFYYS